ncbi:hypothetical protein [Amnibacterium setariae]|uniref:Uncharacterized protein n=1 Tax=Amnibacterium setariae TaxID=2306585 RepID=A0A3A1TUV2_9MICO|nr:hypothetical protein [Amnibacterium setariae]RIX27579.1 hypothetical protein D1781_08360 [Amnibacterium setariae]
MGFILSVRKSVGLEGPEDGGLASALRNIGQIEQYGTVIERDAGADPGPATDPAALPWPLAAGPAPEPSESSESLRDDA